MVKFLEAESRMAAAEGGSSGESAFNGFRVSVWEDGKILEMVAQLWESTQCHL